MRKNDKEVAVGLKACNPHDEMETLKSCILRYFEGKSGSLMLNEQESSILAALTIYFQGNV